MSVQNVNDATETLLYSLNGLSKESVSPFDGLGQEILYGAAVTPLFAFPYRQACGGIKAFYNGGRGNRISAWNTYWDTIKQQKAHLKDNSSLWQTMKNREYYNRIDKFGKEFIPQQAELEYTEFSKLSRKKQAKYNYGMQRKSYYSEVQKLINEAKTKKLKGAELKAQLGKIKEAYAKAQLAEHNAITNGQLKPVTRRGKVSRYLKTKSGYYKVRGKYLNAATKAGKTGKLLRGASRAVKVAGKGNALFAVILGLLEIKDIKSAYACDKAEKEKKNYMSNRGNRQLAKSGTKVATGILGYAGGAAAAGAIAGSVFPGLGNVAGAIIGFVGGCIGGAIASWGAGKIWNACDGGKDTYGKSEAELYAEANIQKQKKEIAKSGKAQDELLAEASELLTDDENNFLGDEEQLEAFELLVNEHNKREKIKAEKSAQSEDLREEANAIRQSFGIYTA